MDDMLLLKRAELAERTAKASGEMLEHHGTYKTRLKAENDFVTEMDLKSETLIRDMLLSVFPDDEFYGEESGGALQAVGRWIVDPIDGTVNFMRGNRNYSISIAYEHDGVLLIGCVYCPGTQELFLGIKGHGATLNGKRICVSDISDLRRSIVHLGLGHRHPEYLAESETVFFPLMRSISDIRRTGSAAYDICCVASGRCEAFIEQGLSIYDYAAGYVILNEAGGSMEGWHPWQNPLTTGCLIAANGTINSSLSRLLNPHEKC